MVNGKSEVITEDDWQKMFMVRDGIAKGYFGIDMYDAQKEFSNKIIKAVINDTGETICSEFTRQSGKTEAVCITCVFLLMLYFHYKKKFGLYAPTFFNIGIFAPQQEQANTDFIKIRDYLEFLKDDDLNFEYRGNNSDRVTIISGSCPKRNTYCLSLSPTSHSESKTLHLIFFEESQDILDFKVNKTAIPMGAQTNAAKVFIGTAGYKKCTFKENLDRLPDAQKIIVPYDRALREREKKFKETGNPIHLNYKKHITREIRRLGLDDDEFRTQYRLIWVLERGQFIVYDDLIYLEHEYSFTTLVDENNVRLPQEVYPGKCTAGIDWGKVNDSTVLTIVSDEGRIIYWLELKGDDYNSQVHLLAYVIKEFFPGCHLVNCDATANQDMAVDPLRAALNTGWLNIEVNGIKFSAESKDTMYKNLSRLMKGKKMNNEFIEEPWIKFPSNWEGVEKEKFIKQLCDLQKEIRNYKWVCEHPKGKMYHDDYPDSLALAVYDKKEEVAGSDNYVSMVA